MKTLNEIKINKKVKNYRLEYNLSKISNLTGGFNSGELITIGTRPGKGKTTLGLNILSELNSQNLTTLFISCEMTSEEVKSKIDKYVENMEMSLKPSKLFIDEGKFNLFKIEQDIRECNPQIVVIDYVQLLQENVKRVTGEIKKLAQKYNCVIFALAQLNRGAETSKPRLGLLKDCGNIEQDSDQV
ncbi:MAG: DnaB helicase C-terminal domain-containing protein [Mycoplasmoidaceae bacterium]|nr:DnaB helicase C-terminal domain-containing protein [Mycoplasmoidaceae bacterium]